MKRVLVAVIHALLLTSVGVADFALAEPRAHANHWDRSRNWWRGRPEWRGYVGRRSGYAFAPGYGYYRIDPKHGGWRRGQYVPAYLRARYVRDPAFFGVRPAPRGYAWIWCGEDILLISLSSGLILDVVHHVY